MRYLKSFLRNSAGNMSIMFALGMGVILMGVGAAVDMSQLTSTKLRTSNLADGMALAAAIAAQNGSTRAQRIELGEAAAQDVFEANLASLGNSTALVPVIDVNDITKDVTVTVKAEVDFSIMGMFGQGSSTASSETVVSYKVDEIPPISLAFAFDTSISMSYDVTGSYKTRLEVLQESTQLLFDAMESEASDPVLLKAALSTTFSSYNIDLVDSEDWSFGADSIDSIIDYVDDMVPNKGTNSTPSLQYSFDQLVTNRPSTDPNWHGYVLFLTDGTNTESSQDEASLAICDQLKADPSITVITVTLDNLEAGQAFVEGCASDGRYYQSENAAQIRSDFADIGRSIGQVKLRIKS